LRQAYDYWQDQPGNYLDGKKGERRGEIEKGGFEISLERETQTPNHLISHLPPLSFLRCLPPTTLPPFLILRPPFTHPPRGIGKREKKDGERKGGMEGEGTGGVVPSPV
jgi:hypothetical protein